MTRLYNSSGYHIANLVNGRLHAPTGENIGRQVDSGDLVDISGNYLGEIVDENRLMKRLGRGVSGCFGNAGTAGSIGNHGNPGNIGATTIGGYDDVDL